jgi:hypothetical protein
MTVETLSFELEVDADLCCDEDELAVELVIPDLTSELVLPSNWVSMVTERRANTMTSTNKVDRFFFGSIMT